ncbi:NADP-dependent oxidoreductase [Rhodococcus fascians]|jgi:NADPH-dependent curcumin reductase CurA|uniref:NADP-dependent oxidoreductase n=1 Tax=Nocardiaceae TaxID=85025 RepID=UPI0004290D02|nr:MULTISPECIES: NADP-dependent oxidoreductase [Rhodococcus]MBY3793483.1 NADP-dependent oxidoreductase [Rhodococcus fascians]MBY3826240.1 NADP-dependent oxidoreductase [Rhodococcus fascians]MBY3836702.1 NADP-dependent oxidoreductase [Rhodococcus fascians]MBY3865831.1 NADP-dependent oxidoreductase [Rhodococcus fascians]MBY3885384.1 NADP-dependent oxidoreductase [Rhodococcus fascians]
MKAHEIHLASRPEGWPTEDNFRAEVIDLPELQDGQILVRNIVMSVDPYMRGRMNDVKSYVPPFQLDAPLDGGAVGEVVESKADGFAVGDAVVHGKGWRDLAIVPAQGASKVDLGAAKASAYLSALGMTGTTAYAGLTAVASFQKGDVVFVSGAAGAVGSLVGQIAKALGASRVIGSAGSPAKVARLLELGFDAAFDYHDGPVAEQLRQAAPDGIDVYFDNVGGDHLEAAIGSMNKHGRIAMCGAIAQYNSTEPTPAPRNLALAIGKELTLKGFIVGSYAHLTEEFRAKMTDWLASGAIEFDETIVEGLDNAPAAFIGLMKGENTGKMVVTI